MTQSPQQKKSPAKKSRPVSASKKDIMVSKQSSSGMRIKAQGSMATTAKFNTEEDEAPVPRTFQDQYNLNRQLPMKKVSPKKYSPKKRPSSPNRRPASPSKLATHLDPDPSWARTFVRGQYYDDTINIVGNSSSPKKAGVKHGQMNFFMGNGEKKESWKTSNHMRVDDEGNLVFAQNWRDRWGQLDMQLGGDQTSIKNANIR